MNLTLSFWFCLHLKKKWKFWGENVEQICSVQSARTTQQGHSVYTTTAQFIGFWLMFSLTCQLCQCWQFLKAVCVIYMYIICCCQLSHFLYGPLVNGPGLYLDGQSPVGSLLVFSSLIQSPSIICCLDAALRHPVQGVREAAQQSDSWIGIAVFHLERCTATC